MFVSKEEGGQKVLATSEGTIPTEYWKMSKEEVPSDGISFELLEMGEWSIEREGLQNGKWHQGKSY